MNASIREAQKTVVESSSLWSYATIYQNTNVADRSERARVRLERASANSLPLPAMVRVAFRCASVEESCEVERTSSLADVQQLLCRFYRQSFPAKKAVLTSDDVLFDAFVQCPSKTCSEGAAYEVKFVDTDDPFFYDKFDRGPKIELEEEVAYDDAVAAGTATTGIEAWVLTRRAVELRTA